MAKHEAFLALEASTAATLDVTWRRPAMDLMDALYPLLEAGRYGDAYDEVQRFSLRGTLTQDKKNKLEELGVSSMLFGAGQLTPVRQTALATGHQSLPDILPSAINQLTVMVEDNGSELIRDAVRQAIETLEEEAKQQVLVVKADSAFDLGTLLNAAVLGTGKAVMDVGANLTTSRLISYGFLAEAVEIGVTTYQINEVLDARTCPVCRIMHGRTFEVTSELGRVDQRLRTLDPQELKSMAPWPKNTKAGLRTLQSMTEADMQSAGYGSPPFHPGCRGFMSASGTVTTNIQPVGPEAVASLQTVSDALAPRVTDTFPARYARAVELGLDEKKKSSARASALRQLVQDTNGGAPIQVPVVSTETFNSTRGTVLFRGVEKAEYVAAQYDEQDFFGRGVYGSGQYHTSHAGVQEAASYGNIHEGGWTYASKLKDDARIIDYTDMTDDKIKASLYADTSLTDDQREKLMEMFDADPSTYAYVRGYDAIRVSFDREDYIVVINKTKLIVAEESLPGSKSYLAAASGAGVDVSAFEQALEKAKAAYEAAMDSYSDRIESGVPRDIVRAEIKDLEAKKNDAVTALNNAINSSLNGGGDKSAIGAWLQNRFPE